MWRYCLHFLRRPADAEDALQQTFLQAHRALARGVEPEAEAAWLLAIARNVCLTRADTQRRRGRTEVAEDPQLLDVVATADADDVGVSDELRAALARLPDRQRQALFLREWQECSYAEIAAALDTSESAVETLLFRARRTLARELRASRLTGLFGWLRFGLGPAAAKVVVGVVVVGVAVAGSDAPTQGRRVAAAPVAHTQRPVIVRRAAPHVVTVVHARATPRRAHHVRVAPRRHSGAAVIPSPPSAATSSAPTPPVQHAAPATSAAAPSAPPTPSRPASPSPAGSTTTTAAVTTTAANSVDATTNAVASTVDTVAQTASTAVPAAAPVVTTAAQTVADATSAVDSTAQAATSTVTQLLPGH